jgi:hypothetical protein
MQPDLVWIKARGSSTLSDHVLDDSVRGATNDLFANLTTAEGANNSVRSFNSSGFSVGNSTRVNQSSIAYVGWQWKEGPTQGFDIVTYTGNSTASRTIAHSLGVTPSMIIVKNRSAVQNWAVAHTSLATGFNLLLDSTLAQTNGGTRLRLGTSTTFTVGDAADYGITNQTSQNYVAYLFAAVAGFSRFGSYTGNGSADGPFIFTGFRPRWVMIKRTDAATDGWIIQDTARAQFNLSDAALGANTNIAEFTGYGIDMTSNGFKIRNASNGHNGSGATYVYAAFAENPFKHSLAR